MARKKKQLPKDFSPPKWETEEPYFFVKVDKEYSYWAIKGSVYKVSKDGKTYKWEDTYRNFVRRD